MAKSIDIFKFTKKSNIKNWRIVNDGVMGGLSSSTFSLNKEGRGVFKGTVSTENYGGFASVRYYTKKIKLDGQGFISIKVKGDGKNYQFRIKHKQSDYYSYINTFSTSGQWEEIKLKLDDFYPGSRGRKLDIPNFDKNSIEQISILIANKKNERFELELESIQIIQ